MREGSRNIAKVSQSVAGLERSLHGTVSSSASEESGQHAGTGQWPATVTQHSKHREGFTECCWFEAQLARDCCFLERVGSLGNMQGPVAGNCEGGPQNMIRILVTCHSHSTEGLESNCSQADWSLGSRGGQSTASVSHSSFAGLDLERTESCV